MLQLTLIASYFFAYVGSVVALFRPFIGLCIFYSFLFLGPQYLFGSIVGKSYQWSLYLAIGTIVGTVFLWMRSSFKNMTDGFLIDKPLRNERSILLIFGVFLVIFICSSLVNPSVASERSFFILLKIFIMFSVGCYLLDSTRRLEIFLWVILISQAFLTVRLNKWYFIDGFNSLLRFDGYGSLNNNTFALSLLPGIGLAIMGVIYHRGLLRKAISFLAAISSMHVVLLSESRGGYLGLATIMLVGVWYIPKNMKTILSFVLATIVLLALSGESVQKEFSTIFVEEEKRDGSAQSRFIVWGSAFNAMLEHPFIGVGPGNFFHVTGEGKKKVAHNLYLQTGAETGIPGFLVLILLYFQAVRRSHQFLNASKHTFLESDLILRWGAGGAVSGLLGYMTHSFFSAGIHIETPYVLILVSLAVFRLFQTQKDATYDAHNQKQVLAPAVQ